MLARSAVHSLNRRDLDVGDRGTLRHFADQARFARVTATNWRFFVQKLWTTTMDE